MKGCVSNYPTSCATRDESEAAASSTLNEGHPKILAEDANSREDIAEAAESLLESPGDPEIGPPVPASAVAASAFSPRDFLRTPTTGGSTGEILRLAWPVIASQVLLNLTGLIDRMMIGRLADDGSAAIPLAAVGYATQLFHLIPPPALRR